VEFTGRHRNTPNPNPSLVRPVHSSRLIRTKFLSTLTLTLLVVIRYICEIIGAMYSYGAQYVNKYKSTRHIMTSYETNYKKLSTFKTTSTKKRSCFFDFPERFGDLSRSTCGPFRNGRKKEREKLNTDEATTDIYPFTRNI